MILLCAGDGVSTCTVGFAQQIKSTPHIITGHHFCNTPRLVKYYLERVTTKRHLQIVSFFQIRVPIWRGQKLQPTSIAKCTFLLFRNLCATSSHERDLVPRVFIQKLPEVLFRVEGAP